LNSLFIISINRDRLDFLMTGEFLNVGRRELIHTRCDGTVPQPVWSRRDNDLAAKLAEDVVRRLSREQG
jgi:hypothetical protein